MKLLPGATPAEAHWFEDRFGVRLPEDLKMLYSRTRGMEEGEWDEEMISLWRLPTSSDFDKGPEPFNCVLPLATVVPESEGSEGGFLIGDWSIMAFWLYGVFPTEPTQHTRIFYDDGENHHCIADSIEAFSSGYLARGFEFFHV